MIADLARELMSAWTTGGSVAEPPSSRDPDFDLDAAYAVEAELRRMRVAAGHKVTGRKVGYANKAVWRALKLETLAWASMYDDTVHAAAALGEFSLADMVAPRIEPEIVFRLKSAPAGGLDAAGAIECVEWMALGFEIIDCPFPGWQFKPADFVAAFGLHRALVVGPPGVAGSPDQLAGFKVRLSRNGELAEEGAGKNSLRSPALCLAELAAAALRQAPAFPLEGGELVSTGTLTGPQSPKPGDTWRAEVEGLAVGALELRFG